MSVEDTMRGYYTHAHLFIGPVTQLHPVMFPREMDVPDAAFDAHSPARNPRYPTIPTGTVIIVDDIVNLGGGDDDSDFDDMPALEYDLEQPGWLAAESDRRLFRLEWHALFYGADSA
jgi:hypothetical protein